MDERRARIHDDLRGVVSGELYFEPLERAPYAHDASLVRGRPAGSNRPADPGRRGDGREVRRREPDPAARPRGGYGLGRRGDRTRAGDRPEPAPAQGCEGHCGPRRGRAGVVLDVLNGELAPLGRRVEPVPVNAGIGTVGGMISVDAAGARSLRFGSMGDQVEQLRVVFAEGEMADLGSQPWPAYDDEPADLKGLVVRKLQNIYRQSRKRLALLMPAVPRNRAGYALDRAAGEGGINLARLVAGSEGTLAIVVQAVLRTTPLPAAQGAVVLPFARLTDAAAGARECMAMGLGPTVCDLYDWRLLSLARDADPRFRCWVNEAAESALIVEFESDSAEEAARQGPAPDRADRPQAPAAAPRPSRSTVAPSASGSWASGGSPSRCS